MKKFMKLAVGVGLAAATIGLAAMPANAAEVDTAVQPSAVSTTATQDMLVGPWSYADTPGGSHATDRWYGFFNSAGTMRWANQESIGDRIAVPQVGDTGPIRLLSGNFAGKCVGIGAANSGLFDVSPVDCDSAPDVEIAANGEIWTTTAAGVRLSLSDEKWRSATTSVDQDHLWLQDFAVQPVQVGVEPVDVTGPMDGESVASPNPTFTGTGDEGAEVVVTDGNGQELCRTTVVGGVWDCTSTVALPAGPVDATATQTATDGSTSTDTVSFTIPVSGPVVDGAIAGGAAALAALAAVGGVIVFRNRKNTATV